MHRNSRDEQLATLGGATSAQDSITFRNRCNQIVSIA